MNSDETKTQAAPSAVQDVSKPDVVTDTNDTNKPAVSTDSLVAKKKILVVDDEPDARSLFSELLSTNGNYEVQVAEDGVDALAKCAITKFDLILLDIVMPKLDGVDTLTQIKADKEKYGEPIVIMLTNIGGDIAIEKALELGAVGFKLKIDTEPEELLKAVDDALNKRPVANSESKQLF